jgi:AcrR family transcriptional regulator
MSSAKDDLRVRRTLFLLKNALQRLLTEKQLEEISVKEICVSAMVHRATFYTHFQDKYHLFSEVLADIKRQISGNKTAVLEKKAPARLYEEFAERALQYVVDHKTMLQKTLNHNKDSMAYLMIYHTVQDYITDLLHYNRKAVEYILPIDVISRFITAGLTALVFFWIETEAEYSQEEMLKMINTIIHQNLYFR